MPSDASVPNRQTQTLADEGAAINNPGGRTLRCRETPSEQQGNQVLELDLPGSGCCYGAVGIAPVMNSVVSFFSFTIESLSMYSMCPAW